MSLLDAPAESFEAVLRRHDAWPLVRRPPSTLQINVGKLCNQACHHCHVDAGPKRTEVMSAETAAAVLGVLGRSSGIGTVDLTGGAPELVPCFRDIVETSRSLGCTVIDRCNLTVLFEPGMDWLPEFLAAHEVELICSLPCYSEQNVDRQRGSGVFSKSIEALRLLNGLGFGQPESPLALHLVYNPVGAFLPPPQAELERKYHDELRRMFGIEFHRLLTITNMPIKRFADQLHRSGGLDAYLGLLVNHFNPATVDGLMCRDLVSVGWEGSLYDCDFNQMLEIPLRAGDRSPSIHDLERTEDLAGLPVSTASHCFGCTAGAGSSCGGALGG